MSVLPLPLGTTLAGNFCVVCESWSYTESFHLFPKNAVVREKWIANLGVHSDKIRKNSKVCSLHFNDNCYSKATKDRRRLLPGSIPNCATIIKTSETQQLEATEGTNNASAEQCTQLDSSVPTTSSRKRSLNDLTTSTHFSSPKKAKRSLEMAANIIDKQKMKIRTLQQKVRHLKNKISSTDDMLNHLKSTNLISREAQHQLQTKCSDSLSHLIQRKLQGQKEKYSPELRRFAITLQFYSSKAYNYVRKHFGNILPHTATISKWYQVVDGEPGFTKEAFTALQSKACKEEVIINLVMDEMSIRDHIQWHKNQFHGFVDIGTGSSSAYDDCPHARNVLVFMAVSLNGNWKIPLAYFLINSLDGHERANLLTKCLELLSATGAKCHSLTFDGASVNMTMCKVLGANFDYGTHDFRPWIVNTFTKEKIFIFWDAAHMIKLVRNSLASSATICTNDGIIKWQFLCDVQKLQSEEGLSAGNRLTRQHICFEEKKMNVRLAAQTLSNSVAAALLFCKDLNIPQFENCIATATFCKYFNDAFDILNSKHCFAKYQYALPISNNTLDTFNARISDIISYISNLKLPSGKALIHSRKKTGFLGFIINLINCIDLYNHLQNNTSLIYLMTYKLSQDHLEIFFSAVRSRSGANNNPSALQFKFTYKRLLIRSQIGGSRYGNAVDLLNIPILDVTKINRNTSERGLNHLIEEPIKPLYSVDDHDYINSLFELTPFLENVIGYISGFICKKLCPQLHCNICKDHLLSKECHSKLQAKKRWGRLFNASEDVIFICKTVEKQLREHQKFLHKQNMFEKLRNMSFQLVNQKVFLSDEYYNHILNQPLLDNHRFEMINVIIVQYLKLRFHYYCKEMSQKDEMIRSRLSRLIIFKNQ